MPYRVYDLQAEYYTIFTFLISLLRNVTGQAAVNVVLLS